MLNTLQLNAHSDDDIQQAQMLLKKGRLVAIPTETVYGLAADASNPDAVAGIFAAKGRPSNHPIIVHISSVVQLIQWAKHVPIEAYQLAAAFWPGPLTLLLNKADHVSDIVTGGLPTIGLRIPSHPVMSRLLAQSGLCVAAPSANPYKKLSPTTAEQVYASMNGRIDAVLDGGPCQVGLESTIVDLTTVGHSLAPRILRAGPITAEQINRVLLTPVADWQPHDCAVPGNVEAHYQPNHPLFVVNTNQLQDTNWSDGTHFVVYTEEAVSAVSPKTATRMPADKPGYSQQLYNTLYQIDQMRPSAIVVEAPPQSSEWLDVNDRLNRARSIFN